MFNKYFVEQITKNFEGGVAQSIVAYDTYEKAREKYYDTLSSLGGSTTLAYARVELKDDYGNTKKIEIIEFATPIESTEE